MKRTFAILPVSIILLPACGGKSREETGPPANTVDSAISAPEEADTNDSSQWNDGPVDWSTIPESCRDM